MRCGECGGKLHSAYAKTKVQTHRCYRCYRAFQQRGACSQNRGARAEELEAQIEHMIQAVTILPDWRRQINGLLNGGPKLEEIERQRQILDAKFDRLRKLYIDGDIDTAEYEQHATESDES